MKEGAGKTEAIVPVRAIERKLEGTTLTAGQQEALRLILGEGDAVVGVQGYAGTGKTTMLREVVDLAGTANVIGLAPSSSAARTLGREAGIATRTLQWFLARYGEPSPDTEGSLAGKVLVVDEMSLASTAQVRSLMRSAEHLGVARLAMVGDSRQLRAVDAGQPFRQLQQAGMATAVMDDIRRQRNPGLKAAVLDAIAGNPGEALTKLGADVLEVAQEDLGSSAARIWLALGPADRQETALMAPTHVLRREINSSARVGLQEEGILHGRSVTLPVLVNLSMTRAQKREIRNYREGDVVVFHNDLYHYRVKSGDICPIHAIDGDRLALEHNDGRPRHVKPDSDVRFRYDVFESDTIELQAGDRIRWTRNHNKSGLVNGATAVIEMIGKKSLALVTDDGRRLKMDLDDPRLRHIAHAYATTVHAAQGLTRDKVIAVLDSGHGFLANQQTFYVEINRARDEAIILTDNREQLAETLEENTGEVLTALEAVGESLDAAEIARRIPEKESVRDLGVEPTEIGRWKRSRNPDLAPGEPEAIARLKALAALTESSDRKVAALASTEWAREGARALDHVGVRLSAALERQPAVRRVGGIVDPGDYAQWRFQVDSALGAARELLGMAQAPDLAGLVGRADAVLADDDRAFARQATEDHAEAWEARWQDLQQRAAGAGLSVHDHGAAAGAIEGARRLLRDPAVPDVRRDRIAAIVDAFDARSEARQQAETWLAAWEEREPSDAAAAEAAIDYARALVSDPALPSTLKSRLTLAIDRHERLTRVSPPTAAVEAPAIDDAMPHTPAAPDRRVEEAETPRPLVVEDEKEREARREQARDAANRARLEAEAAHRQLEGWEAHLASGRLGHVIAHADEVAQAPGLAAPGRRRLEAAARMARQRLETHETYGDWQAACRSHADAAASRGHHVLDHPGHADLVTLARRLADNPALSETARRAVAVWLSDAEGMVDARTAFLERLVTLRRLVAEAEAQGQNPLDLPETGHVVSWIGENLGSAGVTETERQAMKDDVARYEARQAERIRPDRGISWKF